MEDRFGVEIVVGDQVAYNPPYYKGLTYGFVRKINPKTLTLRIAERGNNSLLSNVKPLDVIVDIRSRKYG